MTSPLDIALMLESPGLKPSSMDDEQLLEALAEVLATVQGRSETVQVKAKEIMAGVALTSKTATEATEAEKQSRIWGKQKAMHLSLCEAMAEVELAGGCGCEVDDALFAHSINAWNRGADRRIYIDEEDGGRYGWKVCFYVTGNNANPPGSMTITSGSDSPSLVTKAKKAGAERDRVLAFCKAVAARWTNINSESSKALAADLKPWAKDLIAYREALGLPQGGGEQ